MANDPITLRIIKPPIPKHYTRWSKAEDDVVRYFYGWMKTRDIAISLGRTTVAVIDRARRFGLQGPRTRQKEERHVDQPEPEQVPQPED
jgi:hypothetical protein